MIVSFYHFFFLKNTRTEWCSVAFSLMHSFGNAGRPPYKNTQDRVAESTAWKGQHKQSSPIPESYEPVLFSESKLCIATSVVSLSNKWL